ncbi:MAG: VTT domain-containing protein [Planctomycetota bacterium]
MIAEVQQLLQWLAMHPHWAYATVAAVAFLESLAFVGLLFPGALLMFGAGALVAGGTIDFWPTFGIAVVGAVLGDGVSYEWGRRCGSRIHQLWPFRRYPRLLVQGEQFVRRHGGKSIAMGRFVGAIRPVVPAVAGMLNMPRGRFYLTNVISATAWAPAYLLPGIAFGMALSLAGEVAARLAVLLCVVLAVMWALLWALRFAYRHVVANAARWTDVLTTWAQRRHGIIRIIADLIDPDRRPHWALVGWLTILLGGTWLFLGVLEDVLTRGQLVFAGQSVYGFLQHLRTAPGDRVMIAVTELGDAAVIFPLVIAAAGWFLLKCRWRDLLYWLAAVGGGTLIVAVLKRSLQVPRPIDVYSGVSAYSFPSGHATMSAIVFGYLVAFIAPSLTARMRMVAYGVAALLVTAIAFSRLYLGAHWLADVAAGVGVGTSWVALLTVARRRRTHDAIAVSSFAVLTTFVFLLAAITHGHARFSVDLERYAVRYPTRSVSRQDWFAGAWRDMPAYRVDIEGENEQPMNVQFAGRIEALKRDLVARNWSKAPQTSLRGLLECIAPSPAIDELPVLPKLHSGHFDVLRLVHTTGEPKVPETDQLVLRLWPTEVRLQPGNVPLWIGYVGRQRVRRFPLLSYPHSADVHEEDFNALLASLPAKMARKEVERNQAGVAQGIRYDSTVLLIETRL